MNLSRKWLNEFVEIDASDREFAEAMTMSGSKVEVTEDLWETMHGIVVGKVTAMERHPDSDHMFVCMIDVGAEAPLQIVTGAQNVSVGDLVPVATDGSRLPDGTEIRSGKLRGVESQGMLCSVKELGLTLHDYPYAIEDGIWILEEGELAPGTDMRLVIGADDHVVEFEITPNRPDCLSVIGLAREAAVTFDKPLKLHTPVVKGCGGDINELASITIDEAELCPRYTARMVKNVKIGPSPAWMRERLRNSGVRPINNIVDITNYVMLELGQPMHAFDFSCVEGGKIIVRRARKGEVIQTLDGNDRALTENMLCICDENRPVCVAGVMGGANSEIVGDTAMVLFESANFDGTSVRRTAAALNMRTDASARYEKGLDIANTMKAVQRACELVEELGCGEVVDGIIDVMPGSLANTKIELTPDKINALLGTAVSEDDMRSILVKLGFELEGNVISVPSWRSDVEHWSDIAEEVARFFGYNNIPSVRCGGGGNAGGYSKVQRFEMRCGELCRAMGYDEIITYSFISPSYYDKICLPSDSPLRRSKKILNPLGEDTSIMRTTTLPSMLDILVRNYNNRNKNVRLYELGKTYFAKEDKLAREPKVLTLSAYGDDMDFYAFKGHVETALKGLRIPAVRFAAEKGNPSYHPGRCAVVYSGETLLGVFGQVHPTVAANFGAEAELYAAELQFDALFASRSGDPIYQPLPRFPSVTRDLAVLADAALSVGELSDCIRRNGGEFLREVKFFDVYAGKGIPEGKKSVAFSLILRSDEGTLTFEHADGTIKGILAGLEKELGAVMR
ncbi:MAG: phenylalanine--tRNA ligase subunit beta [Ruminococcaceae bacterium]|nr:phenylalanine--tRNA ligase subunit beta [Oscillospiraceae bacterium]